MTAASKPESKSPVVKAVTKEAGAGVGADKPVAKATVRAKAPAIEVTQAMIAEAAYYMHMNGVPGSQEDHWAAAEAQLRGGGSAQA